MDNKQRNPFWAQSTYATTRAQIEKACENESANDNRIMAQLARAATRRLRICRRLRGVRASRTVQGGRKDSLKRPESGQGRPDRTSVQTDLVVPSEHSHRVSGERKGCDPKC